MQASQSNNASDLLKLDLNSDAKPEANLSRIFPSPFSAPIQAARRYIERQRGDVPQAGARESGSAGQADSQAASRPPAWGAEGLSSTLREDSRDSSRESSRERDRRLERSLYEGHSFEAGLNYEGVDTSVPGETASAQRVSLAGSDGTEALFRDAIFPDPVAGTLPDPGVVRGAIFRLARESERRREPWLSSGVDSREAEEIAEAASSAMKQVPPLNFSEVARRVWEASAAQTEVAGAIESTLYDDNEFNPAAPAAAAAATGSTGSVTGEPADEEVKHNFVPQTVPQTFPQVVPLQTATAGDGIGAGQAELDETHLRQIPQPVTVKVETAAAIEGVTGPQRVPAAGICDVEAEPALAHDACNLLSALALYSELLGSPGVLEKRYGHYAQELKLVAVRSQTLIKRLLQAAGAPQEPQNPQALQEPQDQIALHHCLDRATGISSAGSGTITAGRGTAGFDGEVAGHSEAKSHLTEDVVRATESCFPHAQTVQPVSRARTGVDQEHVIQSEGAVRANDEVAAASTIESAQPEAVLRRAGERAETERTNLAELLERWDGLLSTLACGKLEVVPGAHASTPLAVGAEALERILVNLVRNARAATVAGGAIRIGIGVDDAGTPAAASETTDVPSGAGTMVLTVDDSGCGMTEVQVRRLLGDNAGMDGDLIARHPEADDLVLGGDGRRPDHRDSERQSSVNAVSQVFRPGEHGPGPGSEPRQGLGLRIVRELVASSGGALAIQSWPGRGTRVEVRWPVLACIAAGAAAKEAKPHPVDALADPVPTVLQAAPLPGTAIPPRAVPVELTGAAVGPDGFSEMELRAMMLRLHRAGPQERSPLSRRLSGRPGGAREADCGFGVTATAIHGLPSYAFRRNDPALEEPAAKGAIAC